MDSEKGFREFWMPLTEVAKFLRGRLRITPHGATIMLCHIFTNPSGIWHDAETSVISAERTIWAELPVVVIVHYSLRKEQLIPSQGLEHVERCGAPVAKVVI